MKHLQVAKWAIAGAMGCGLAGIAAAVENTQPMKGHPDWGYAIYGLSGSGTAKQTAYVFTNQNAALSWTAPSDVTSVRLLVVGGGGAGGGRYDATAKDAGFGGGGGGGFTAVDAVTVTPGATYAVVVGKGGASSTSQSENGEQSSFVGTGVEARADGGGFGGGFKKSVSGVGGDGANGGGGGFFWSGSGTSYPQQAGGGATGFGAGFSGGKNGDTYRSGGGGGGAGGAGATPTSKVGGVGGAGKTSDITGRDVCYAGGGGGGGNDTAGGAGGAGGGGNGGIGNGTDGETGTKHGIAGTDGLGGGGGGSAQYNALLSGGRGGSGVVIVRCDESAEDPNPMPFDRDPIDNAWTGEGANANWSTEANWQSPLLYIDTAVFPAGCTATVTMDGTTDARYPAATLLSVGANAQVTLNGANVNYISGNKAAKLLDDGASLSVAGAGNALVLQNPGGYVLGANTTLKALGGAKLDLPRVDGDCSIDLNAAQGVMFVVDGADSWLDLRSPSSAQRADVAFQVSNGGLATPQGGFSGADSRLTVRTSDGGWFQAHYLDVAGAVARLAAGPGTKLEVGFLDAAAGSAVCVTNGYVSVYSNGGATRLGANGEMTLELVGANPQFEKLYHVGGLEFGSGLTVRMRPESTWAAGPRVFATRTDSASTVAAGVRYEIDCGGLDPTLPLTFRFCEFAGNIGTVAPPSAANVRLTGANAGRFTVSAAKASGENALDFTLTPKPAGIVFSID